MGQAGVRVKGRLRSSHDLPLPWLPGPLLPSTGAGLVIEGRTRCPALRPGLLPRLVDAEPQGRHCIHRSSLSLQDEATKGESTEKEPSPPESEDDGKRHGFLILSREDSTMVGLSLDRAWFLAVPGGWVVPSCWIRVAGGLFLSVLTPLWPGP